jgi:hypothetical protein
MYKTKAQRSAAVAVDFILNNQPVTMTALTLKINSLKKDERGTLTALILRYAEVSSTYAAKKGPATKLVSLTKKAAELIVKAAGEI